MGDHCRKVVIKIRHLYPDSHIVVYDLAILLKVSAQQVIQSEKSSYKKIKKACDDLELACQYFDFLQSSGEKNVFHFPKLAQQEFRTCKDLTIQARMTEARAKKLEEEFYESRKKQQELRE